MPSTSLMSAVRIQFPQHHRAALPAVALVLALSAVPAARADLLGAYVGAAAGQGRIDTGNLAAPPPATSPGSFTEDHSAYKLLAGVRAIAIAGAEIEYLDLGHPSRSFSSPSLIGSADVKMRGGAAFGMLYLPVPVVDVFVKGGLARLQATTSVNAVLPGVGTCPVGNPNCARVTLQNTTTNTTFAAGAGVQMKLGPVAVRAEYERFSAAGGHPGLASVGALWNFL